MATKDKYITIRIEPEIHARLKEMAERDYRSLTNQIQLILKQAVEADEESNEDV